MPPTKGSTSPKPALTLANPAAIAPPINKGTPRSKTHWLSPDRALPHDGSCRLRGDGHQLKICLKEANEYAQIQAAMAMALPFKMLKSTSPTRASPRRLSTD